MAPSARQADVARVVVGVVALVAIDLQRDRHHGDDPGGPQLHGGAHRYDLQHPAVDVVVVSQGAGGKTRGTLADAMTPSKKSIGPPASPGTRVTASSSTMVPSWVM